MIKRKTKSDFIGMRVSRQQSLLLAKLQQVSQLPSKTDVLLQGLDLLARYHGLDSTSVAGTPPGESALARQYTTSLELSNLRREALRYANSLEEIKNRTEEVIRGMTQELSRVEQIVDKYQADKGALIQMLLEVQRENRWLPKPALLWISQRLGVPISQIYQIATFYKAFSLVPQGRHSVSVCMGTACHVRGAPRLLDRVTDALNIKPGETSPDQRFTLSTVNCLGCCALGPVMTVDGEYYGKMSPAKVDEVLNDYD
jgi:NADH-quinone oxidoreductase subunit E